MQRWTALALALLFGVAVALLVAQPGTRDSSQSPAVTSASASSSMAPAPVTAEEPAEPTHEPAQAASGRLLPEDAPKTVGFGVIQIPYQGAQFAQAGAAKKQDALTKARALVSDAERDFESAAKQGDSASGADLGDIPRGVLEPELEFVLFTLKVGEVHREPLDTPRGFWILRRTR